MEIVLGLEITLDIMRELTNRVVGTKHNRYESELLQSCGAIKGYKPIIYM